MNYENIKSKINIDSDLFIDTKESKDAWIVDKLTKKKYLDCFSQFASQPFGWNSPYFEEYKDRLADAAINKIANSDIMTEEYAIFIDKFSNICKDFQKFFFIEGGSAGVENAIKTAFDWKCQRLGMNKPNELDIIHFKDSFHGRGGYAISLTNNSKTDHKTKLFPKFPWTRVTKDNKGLETAEAALKFGNVAAIIVETIQGEPGDFHFEKEFLNKLKKLSDHYDCLMILDEVQCGGGITGTWWAYQQKCDFTPDLMCFGKKMQVCGFSANLNKLNKIKDHVFNVSSRISSTWGGNSVDMVRSSIIIEIIEKHKILENVKKIGNYLLNELNRIGLDNVRGLGLMIAFDAKTKEIRDSLLEKLNQDMIILPCGEKSIRFRPHLTFTGNDVDSAISILKKHL